MGVAIVDLLKPKEISFNDLKGKIVAVDAFNMLYQFLTTIRQADGTPLKDSKGNITSHLIGLFSRTTNLMSKGIKIVFVFDGEVPELKRSERERRETLKEEALKEYEIAKEREDIAAMKKYASRTTKLTPDMVDEAKALIKALGLPIIQAPGEGEAQAAYMVKKGNIFALVTQDIDGLMFGAPRLVRNLNITRKRKSHNKLAYQTVKPELIVLSETLNELGIDHEQLIVLGMLVGTDYNIGGIKGIGPKKALDLVKKFGSNFDALFEEVKWNKYFEYSWKDVFNLFKNAKVTDDYELKWNEPDENKIIEILVNKHEFSIERVENTIKKFIKSKEERKQKALNDFF